MTKEKFLQLYPNYVEIPLGQAKNHCEEKFTRLKPICRVKNLNKPNHPNVQWLCQCDCGNIIIVNSSSLTSKHTKSCGCLQKEVVSQREFKDETGNKYGKLTVLNLVPNYEYSTTRCAYWRCKCDCGNEVIVRGTALRNGTTTSCGCIQSKGEQKIQQILTINNIKFQPQFSFADLKDKECLRFDFAVFNSDNSLSYLIEYQGE